MPRSIIAATILLTFGTGVVDVSSFLRLGHVFASVMTGNLVLLGLAAGTGNGTLARSGGTALVGYAVGVAVSSLVSRPLEGHRHRWAALSAMHLLVLAGWVVLWVTVRDAGTAGESWTLGVAAAAMGVQSSLVRLVGGQGMSTTYLTSTLTRLVWDLGHHGRVGWGDPARCAALVVGAVSGGLLAQHAAAWTPAPAAAAAVLAAALWHRAAPAAIAGAEPVA
ncbi:MAG TPA: YoaK family protein [Nocardioides sp.]|uniref:YoaK family protein n=1 Tax=Nocardioides sp. TaxID=35761 RepID=UPI002F409472